MNGLGGKFENMSYILNLSKDTVDKDLVSFADMLNNLATDLVNINESLRQSVAHTGELSAQLLDSRYSVLAEMAEITDISVFEDSDGIASVYVGGGIALVANNKITPISAEPDGFSDGQYEIYIRGNEVSDLITGGKLGGVLEYRRNVLNTSENEIGRIALGFAQMANVTHKEGFTPSGVAGAELLANYSSVAQSHKSNTGVALLNVSFDVSGTVAAQTLLVGQLKAVSYEVVDTGAGYDVYNADSGSLLLSGAGGAFTLDGLDFNMAGASLAGDRFKISPMSDAIDGYDVVISNTQDFANSFDPLGSSSDNRNTLSLFDLKSLSVFNGGMDNFQGSYSTLVAKVGSKVSLAESSATTFAVLKDQASLHRDSESGVNIEEEAAQILKLQQHFSASAKIITASQEIFDELMDAIR
jgi:flagellar hook-associated protein 1 FlgK